MGFIINKAEKVNITDIDNLVYLYFPVDRYYTPQWLNKENKPLHMDVHTHYLGKSTTNLICQDLLFNIESWVLDVVMDKLLYEELTTKNEQGFTIKLGYHGKNTNIQSNINTILSKLFSGKYSSARIGVSSKDNNQRNISIIGRNNEGIENEVVSSFANLSSGEVMLFSIACMILKEYDRITNNPDSKLEDISGIVLIDEIDIHLHSDFAKNIAPMLVQLFPNIQFIISSH